MVITINRELLINNISMIASVATRNHAMPILEYVKVNVREDGMMVVTAFDNELLAMKKFHVGSVSEAIDFCVMPKDLINALKTMRDEVVALDVSADKCVVRHAKGELQLPALSTETFPNVDAERDAKKFSYDGTVLEEWLKKSIRFAANDKLRPILNGAYLYVKDGESGVAASDGHVLFSDFTTCDDKELDANGTLTTKSISTLLNLISGEEKVVCYFGDNMVTFRTPTAMLHCMKPVGRYPNFKTLVARPKDAKRVNVNKGELLDSAMRAMLTTGSLAPVVKLSVDNNVLTVTSESLEMNKRTHEECSCVSSGGDMKICVNVMKFTDCLGAVSSNDVVLEMTDPTRAIYVLDEACENRVMLCMPYASSD